VPGLVSTIIPVYNRAALLAEAVGSVLAQTYRPVEVVIVDDGSTDDTPAAADTFAAAHPDVVRVVHQANGGVGRAREAGRLAARGAFIQYLDSDDLLLPRKFTQLVATLDAQPDCGIAYGITRYRNAAGDEVPCTWKPNNLVEATLFPSLLRARWWETVAPLFRREVTDAIGPWTTLNLEEDWEYDSRAAALGVRLAFVNEVLAEHRDHADARLSRPNPSPVGRQAPSPVVLPAEPTEDRRGRLSPQGERARARLRDRARAHELILAHALRAGVSTNGPEMQQFVRELFHLARQCGAAGLGQESQRLVAAARSVSSARDLRVYERLAGLLGWAAAGRLSMLPERLRR
jgi:hypothetical protein